MVLQFFGGIGGDKSGGVMNDRKNVGQLVNQVDHPLILAQFITRRHFSQN